MVTDTGLSIECLPSMAIFTMDGNGRFGKAHGMTSSWGHAHGGEKAREIMKLAQRIGLKKIGLWIASTDNFKKRSSEEMDTVVRILKQYLREFISESCDVRLRFCGSWAMFVEDEEFESLVHQAEMISVSSTGMEVTLFFAYGGEQEIIDTAKQCIRSFVARGASLNDIDKIVTAQFVRKNRLCTWVPERNVLCIRTGETPPADPEAPMMGHISDFLPFDLRGMTFVFTPTLWPEFTGDELRRILWEYGGRPQLLGASRSAA